MVKNIRSHENIVFRLFWAAVKPTLGGDFRAAQHRAENKRHRQVVFEDVYRRYEVISLQCNEVLRPGSGSTCSSACSPRDRP
jgi:hypothetical protein